MKMSNFVQNVVGWFMVLIGRYCYQESALSLEMVLKLALNTNQPINQSINKSTYVYPQLLRFSIMHFL
jgi:hypothetical protein